KTAARIAARVSASAGSAQCNERVAKRRATQAVVCDAVDGDRSRLSKRERWSGEERGDGGEAHWQIVYELAYSGNGGRQVGCSDQASPSRTYNRGTARASHGESGRSRASASVKNAAACTSS